MNKARRKELYNIVKKLMSLQGIECDKDNTSFADEIGDIKTDLEFILSEEEYSMDNIPENLQGGYRYQVAEEACDNLQNAIDELDDDYPNINEAINYISQAAV